MYVQTRIAAVEGDERTARMDSIAKVRYQPTILGVTFG
jgi:hypothetical protein